MIRVVAVLSVFLTVGSGAWANSTGQADDFYARARLPTVGVFHIVARLGYPEERRDVLLDMLSGEIAGLGPIQVVSKSDIMAVFQHEQQQKLVSCSDDSCVAEVAGALGVEWLVTGNISRFGKSHVFNLTLLHMETVRAYGRATRRVGKDDEQLLDELPGMIRELFEPVADQLNLTLGGAKDVVESASKHRQPVRWSPHAVTIFTRKDIFSSGAENLHDLLRRVPGFDVFGYRPSYPLVGCRISTSKRNPHVQVNVDGREVALALTGFPLWGAMPFDLEDVERVEVLRGPASALYGANAFTAVVNVTTRSPKPETAAQALLSAGEIGHLRLGGRLKDF